MKLPIYSAFILTIILTSMCARSFCQSSKCNINRSKEKAAEKRVTSSVRSSAPASRYSRRRQILNTEVNNSPLKKREATAVPPPPPKKIEKKSITVVEPIINRRAISSALTTQITYHQAQGLWVCLSFLTSIIWIIWNQRSQRRKSSNHLPQEKQRRKWPRPTALTFMVQQQHCNQSLTSIVPSLYQGL